MKEFESVNFVKGVVELVNSARTLIALILILFNINPLVSSANSANLLPFEDETLGRNSSAYLSTYEVPSIQMKEDFIKEISTYAMKANENWGIPASAIIGMAIIESGYGTTRIAINANNLFGIKVWGYNPENAWQLQGQPDEDYERIPVLADYGEDRKIYDESKRRDNWYRAFSAYKEAVNYLAGNLLVNQRYLFAKTNYDERIKKGWSFERASKEYLYDIANAGYNHLGGEYYRKQLGELMDEWDLYQYDNKKFKDISEHWAEEQIMFLAEKGWISGYPDGTYKPNITITRAQAAAILSEFLALPPLNKTISFIDVEKSFWALESIQLVAQHKIINGIGEGRFSPHTILTRAQMAQVFYNAGFYSQSANNGENSFDDVNKYYWAYIAIETMKQEGIMAGYTISRFGPNNPVTRAQMAAMIYRIHEKGLNK
ncbi:S-layer homology domain-containing protein [Solibacillus sp. A46]|uniref:S-layer homology domain-containing protein n=1 Tax=Solibacillus faecavium TaxID=2762221 RepID=A0ABR8Y2W8_9BACL|nr:S-layer homology domain-containing protein [Solibacillus faecavium]